MGPNIIMQAFRVQLEKAVVKANISNENLEFNRPSTGIWYEEYCVPDYPVSEGIGKPSDNNFLGFYQINIHIAKNIGKGPAVEEAERLRAYFKDKATLVYKYETKETMLVTDVGSIISGLYISIFLKSFGYNNGFYGEQEGEFVLPVRIAWQACLPA